MTGSAITLDRRMTANGGREWFLRLDGTPIYPNEHGVGVFTSAHVTAAEAFRRVIDAWVER